MLDDVRECKQRDEVAGCHNSLQLLFVLYQERYDVVSLRGGCWAPTNCSITALAVRVE